MSTPLDPGPPTPASALAAAPYKGLDYFEDSPVDRLVFAGRDGDIREVLARIVTQRVLVVYGRSAGARLLGGQPDGGHPAHLPVAAGQRPRKCL